MKLEQKVGISIEGACLGYYPLDDISDLVKQFVFCAEMASGKKFYTELIEKEVNGKNYCFMNIVKCHD